MKKIIILSIAAMSLLFASCVKEDHAVNQKVTYYPVFSIDGGSTVAWQIGDAWVDPGYSATLNGEDITSKIEIVSDLDTDEAGIYSVVYSYMNEDGFEGTATRTVVVYDVANASTLDVSGTYTPGLLRERSSGTSDYSAYVSGNSMTVTAGPGTGLFYAKDLMCGFYEFYYGYGSNYAFKSLFQLNADNTISILQIRDPWGMTRYGLEDSHYDPATGTLYLDWYWAGWASYMHSVYKK